MYSLRPGKLCFGAAYCGWTGVQDSVVVLTIECATGKMSVNVCFEPCCICRWWYGVKNAAVVIEWCVCNKFWVLVVKVMAGTVYVVHCRS